MGEHGRTNKNIKKLSGQNLNEFQIQQRAFVESGESEFHKIEIGLQGCQSS